MSLPIGHRVLHYPEIDSTNRLAATFANDPSNHGLVITADSQTAGRGQYERTWQAPSGSSILMSVLLFPRTAIRRASILTAWAAVSVCETIREATKLQTRIKWPNDVLIGDQKVCGILCEGGTRHIVAGIGLNVNQSAEDFERMRLPTATSIAIGCERSMEVADLTQRLIRNLDVAYQCLLTGEIAAVEFAWKERIHLLGRPVRIEKMDGSEMVGLLTEMAFDGIQLEMGDTIIVVPPEAIRHVSEVVA